MTEYLPEFITIALLHLLAVVSPGPDFVMISRNSLIYSRRTGVFSAAGLALGILVHVTYSIAGIAYIVSQSIVLFSTIKLLGAGYLIYIGFKSLMAKRIDQKIDLIDSEKDLSPLEAIRQGFLTNVLNPKATLFFFSIFSQVIDHATPLVIKMLYGIEMSLATFAWFSIVALVLSDQRIKSRVSGIQHYVNKTMGVLLIALGIKIAVSQK